MDLEKAKLWSFLVRRDFRLNHNTIFYEKKYEDNPSLSWIFSGWNYGDGCSQRNGIDFSHNKFFKTGKVVRKNGAPGLSHEALERKLHVKALKVSKQEGDLLYFKEGLYNLATGEASYTLKELPFILDRMTHLHKANTNPSLYWLNLFFGASLLFFVISSFWRFKPTNSIVRKGIYFAIAGVELTLVLLFV